MRTLVLFTAIGNGMISLAYDAMDSGQTVCVDFDDAIHAQLKQLGISSIPLRMPGDTSWSQRDSDFAKAAMPGSLDFNFPGTNLPVWKVLSLDRLSFWYRGRQADMEYEAVMGLEWETAIAPFSLGHPLPWRLAQEKKVVAMQTEPIRTRAWRDWLSRPVPFSSVFVQSQNDADFLKKFYSGNIYVHPNAAIAPGAPVSPDERNSLRKGMNIAGGAKVALVLFDSQTEWEFRTAFPEIINAYNNVLIYPLRPHDLRNLYDFGVVSSGKVRVVDSMSVEPAADEAILFRYDEGLIQSRRIPVRVIDISQRWDSNLLVNNG